MATPETNFFKFDLQAAQQGLVPLVGRLVGAGAAAPVATDMPWVTSVARNGSTKRVTLTLNKRFYKLVSWSWGYEDTNYGTAATRKYPVKVSDNVNSATAPTIVFQFEDGTDGQANAAVDLATTQAISLTLWMKQTSQSP